MEQPQPQIPAPPQINAPQMPVSEIKTPVQAYITPALEEPESPSFAKNAFLIVIALGSLFIVGMYLLGWYKTQLDISMHVQFSQPTGQPTK